MMFVTTPFKGAGESYEDLSSSLSSFALALGQQGSTGQGAAADTLTQRVEGYVGSLALMSTGASTVSDECATQANADTTLMQAPKVGDVEDAKEALTEASDALREGTGTPEDVDAAREHYVDLKSRHDAAVEAHAEETGGTAFPETKFPEIAPSTPAAASAQTPGASGPSAAPASSGSSGTGSSGSGSDLAAGDTELSSDTGAATASPQLAQMPQQQPTATPPQPQMQPMQSMPPTTPPTGANTGPYEGKRDTAAAARGLTNSFSAPRLDTSIGTSTSGASGPSPVDRGSSINGVTTRGDVSGASTTALSSSTAGQPGSGAAAQQGMGRGGMGGMPMGGMGGGGGGQGINKERPVILTSDPELLGTEDQELSVEGGVLGRDTATSPRQE